MRKKICLLVLNQKTMTFAKFWGRLDSRVLSEQEVSE